MRGKNYIQPEATIVETDSCPVMAASPESSVLPEIGKGNGEVW